MAEIPATDVKNIEFCRRFAMLHGICGAAFIPTYTVGQEDTTANSMAAVFPLMAVYSLPFKNRAIGFTGRFRQIYSVWRSIVENDTELHNILHSTPIDMPFKVDSVSVGFIFDNLLMGMKIEHLPKIAQGYFIWNLFEMKPPPSMSILRWFGIMSKYGLVGTFCDPMPMDGLTIEHIEALTNTLDGKTGPASQCIFSIIADLAGEPKPNRKAVMRRLLQF